MEERNKPQEKLSGEEEFLQNGGLSKEEVSRQSGGLSKEEILERSRKENQSGDERERDFMKWVPYCGYAAGILSTFVFEIIFLALDYDFLYVQVCLVILSTMMSAQIVCQAAVFKKHKPLMLTCAIIVTVCAVAQWVFFGLTVGGVDF